MKKWKNENEKAICNTSSKCVHRYESGTDPVNQLLARNKYV